MVENTAKKPALTFTAPNVNAFPLYDELSEAYNVLIAGTVGSGKSVTENGIIYNIVNKSTPKDVELYLIDPKMVELEEWRVLPHVRGYADDIDGAFRILDKVKDKMMRRYEDMKEMREKVYSGSEIYVLIDEMADLMLQDKRGFSARLQRLLQLGRAAKIHVICCTQSASRVTVPAAVAINFTCCVGLHAATAIESRQIISVAGCEKLPLYGQAIVKTQNGTFEKVAVPMYPEELLRSMRRHYTVQAIDYYRNLQKEV